MINLKLFYVICLLTPCIMALSDLEPESNDIEQATEFATFEEQGDSEVKINWGPVWDDNQGNNEFVIRTDESQEENCDSPSGMGLKNLFKQMDALLPHDKIEKVVKIYSEDPQIKLLRAFAKSPRVQEKLKTIIRSKEYQRIKDYACHILHINLRSYHHLTRALINPSKKSTDDSERKGIKGFIKAIEAILPKREMHDLFEHLMSTDDELVEAVAHIKSKEFHQLLLNLKYNVPEYQELRREIIGLGVPVEEMRNMIAKALGWSEDFDILF